MSYIHTITTAYKKYAAAISLVLCASITHVQADPDITQLTSNNVTEFSISYLLKLSQAQVQSATQSWNLAGFQRMSTSQLIALLPKMSQLQINQIGILNRAGLNFSVLGSTIDYSLRDLISSIDPTLLKDEPFTGAPFKDAPFIRYFGTNVQNISPTKLVPDVLKNMTPQQIAALSTSQIQALTATQISALSPSQLNALSTTQIKELTTTQISTLRADQRDALYKKQIDAAINNANTYINNINIWLEDASCLVPSQAEFLKSDMRRLLSNIDANRTTLESYNPLTFYTIENLDNQNKDNYEKAVTLHETLRMDVL